MKKCVHFVKSLSCLFKVTAKVHITTLLSSIYFANEQLLPKVVYPISPLVFLLKKWYSSQDIKKKFNLIFSVPNYISFFFIVDACPARLAYRADTSKYCKKKLTTECTKKEAQRKARVKYLCPL